MKNSDVEEANKIANGTVWCTEVASLLAYPCTRCRFNDTIKALEKLLGLLYTILHWSDNRKISRRHLRKGIL